MRKHACVHMYACTCMRTHVCVHMCACTALCCVLDSILGHFGAMLGHLGSNLGPSWGISAPCWGILAPTWGHLGAFGRHVGVSWLQLGAFWPTTWLVTHFWGAKNYLLAFFSKMETSCFWQKCKNLRFVLQCCNEKNLLPFLHFLSNSANYLCFYTFELRRSVHILGVKSSLNTMNINDFEGAKVRKNHGLLQNQLNIHKIRPQMGASSFQHPEQMGASCFQHAVQNESG